MKEQNKLTLQMSLLFFVVFVFFGVVVVTEKLSPLKIPRVTQKLEVYLKDNYEDEADNFEMEKVTYKNLRYETIVKNKENNDLYFKIYYENRKITDTYKKDYVEGKTLIKAKEKEIQLNIKKKTNTIYKVKLDKLNSYSESKQKELLTSNKPETLSLYNIEANISVEKLKLDSIINVISIFYENSNERNILPKSFSFIIETEKKKLRIDNLPRDIIESEELKTIINDILNKKESKILEDYNISYEYL